MPEVLLAVGTQKGLFLGRSPDRKAWEFTGPHFPMNAVYSVGVDRRGGRVRLLAGADSSHWGPSCGGRTTWARTGGSQTSPR